MNKPKRVIYMRKTSVNMYMEQEKENHERIL